MGAESIGNRKTAGGRKTAIPSLMLGIGSYTYGWQVGLPEAMPPIPLTIEGLIDKAAGLGIGLIQVGDNHPLAGYENSRLCALRSKLEAAGCAMELGARGLTTSRLKEYMELAEYFRVPLLRFIIDETGYEPDADAIFGIIGERVRALERRRITLAIENHDRLRACDLAAIVKKVDSHHVGICLDSVNSLGAGEGLETVLEHLVPYTVNLHIKDFGIVRLPHKMGFRVEGRLAGTGLLDIPQLLERVASTGKCRSAILEQWVPPEEDIVNTIRKEEQWALESINYLKTIRCWQ